MYTDYDRLQQILMLVHAPAVDENNGWKDLTRVTSIRGEQVGAKHYTVVGLDTNFLPVTDLMVRGCLPAPIGVYP